MHVRPELVVEIAFDGVQASPRYPGGVALRFARVLRHRPDKRAAEADTLDAVLAHPRVDAAGVNCCACALLALSYATKTTIALVVHLRRSCSRPSSRA